MSVRGVSPHTPCASAALDDGCLSTSSFAQYQQSVASGNVKPPLMISTGTDPIDFSDQRMGMVNPVAASNAVMEIVQSNPACAGYFAKHKKTAALVSICTGIIVTAICSIVGVMLKIN